MEPSVICRTASVWLANRARTSAELQVKADRVAIATTATDVTADHPSAASAHGVDGCGQKAAGTAVRIAIVSSCQRKSAVAPRTLRTVKAIDMVPTRTGRAMTSRRTMV